MPIANTSDLAIICYPTSVYVFSYKMAMISSGDKKLNLYPKLYINYFNLLGRNLRLEAKVG